MTILVSANEWRRVKHYMKDDGLPTSLAYDFRLYTESGVVTAERKKVPSDLLASVADGRLARECAAMRQESDYCFLIPEGKIRYSRDGHVLEGNCPGHWTRAGIRNLLRSVRFVDGVDVEFTINIPDTVNLLRELQEYFDSAKHGSYKSRPPIPKSWPVVIYEERFLYWLQGLPSISRTRAIKIADRFSTPSKVFSATLEDWLSIPRFGKKTAEPIYNFLQTGNT